MRQAAASTPTWRIRAEAFAIETPFAMSSAGPAVYRSREAPNHAGKTEHYCVHRDTMSLTGTPLAAEALKTPTSIWTLPLCSYCAFGDLTDGFERVDVAAKHVVRVLDSNQSSGCPKLRRPSYSRTDLLPGEDTVVGGNGADDAAGKYHAEFPIENVRAGFGDYALPCSVWSLMAIITHRAGGDKGGLFTGDCARCSSRFTVGLRRRRHRRPQPPSWPGAWQRWAW